MRHRGGAKCACRVDPRRVTLPRAPRLCCVQPSGGPSMCQRSKENHSPHYFTPTEVVTSFMRRLLFDDPVTSLMTRLHGYVFEMSIFAFLVTQRQLPRGLFQTPPCKPAILFCSRFRRVTTVATDPATPAFDDPAISQLRLPQTSQRRRLAH